MPQSILDRLQFVPDYSKCQSLAHVYALWAESTGAWVSLIRRMQSNAENWENDELEIKEINLLEQVKWAGQVLLWKGVFGVACPRLPADREEFRSWIIVHHDLLDDLNQNLLSELLLNQAYTAGRIGGPESALKLNSPLMEEFEVRETWLKSADDKSEVFKKPDWPALREEFQRRRMEYCQEAVREGWKHARYLDLLPDFDEPSSINDAKSAQQALDLLLKSISSPIVDNPTGGPNGAPTWEFEPGLAIFRGKRIEISYKPGALLKALVDANGTPLEAQQLKESAWEHNEIPTDHAVGSQLTILRRKLREAFGLPEDTDPVPCVDRGARKAWKLNSEIF